MFVLLHQVLTPTPMAHQRIVEHIKQSWEFPQGWGIVWDKVSRKIIIDYSWLPSLIQQCCEPPSPFHWFWNNLSMSSYTGTTPIPFLIFPYIIILGKADDMLYIAVLFCLSNDNPYITLEAVHGLTKVIYLVQKYIGFRFTVILENGSCFADASVVSSDFLNQTVLDCRGKGLAMEKVMTLWLLHNVIDCSKPLCCFNIRSWNGTDL